MISIHPELVLKFYSVSLLLLLFTSSSFIQLVSTDLFSAQVDIHNLFILEQLVREEINLYLVEEEIRLQRIRERFEHSFPRHHGRTGTGSQFQFANIGSGENEKGSPLPFSVPSDPINNFLVVKKLVIDLNQILNVAGQGTHFERLNESIQQLRESHKFPTETDLTGTIQALTRTQETYKLDTAELANGFLAGVDSGSQLNAEDCFELGKQSYGSNEFEQSIKWLTEALNRTIKTTTAYSSTSSKEFDNNVLAVVNKHDNYFQTVSTEEILKYLNMAQSFNQTMLMAKGFVGKSFGIQLEDVLDGFSKLYESASSGNPQVEDSFRNVKLKYEALCRQEIYNSKGYSMNSSFPNQSSQLRCAYGTRNPFLIIGPLKFEVLSISPYIVIFHELLSDSEIEILQELAKPIFRTAEVITTSGGTEISKVRTSKSAWLSDDVHPILTTINNRISALTNLNIDFAEDLQIVNYGTGGQYEPHYDFFYGGQDCVVTDQDGNRLATVLIYMSDVLAGGGTAFPSLDLTVQPKKGSALFWYNLLDDGVGDFRTRHGACPVLIGSKWVANKWIHERGQESLKIYRLPL